MSREVASRVLLYVIAFLFPTFFKVSSYVLPDDCMDFDIGELEDYLSKLNLENVPTVNTMIGGFKCPVTALPFGALKSDWARLLLLHGAQPEESIFREKLGRLFRILAIAYFRIEGRFDVTASRVEYGSSSNVSSSRENGIISTEETNRLDVSTNISKISNGTGKSFGKTEIITDRVVSKHGTISTIGNKNDDFTDTSAVSTIGSTEAAYQTISRKQPTVWIDTTTFSPASEETVSVSDNYPSNPIFDVGTLRINTLDAIEMERVINSSDIFEPNSKLHPTINYFTRDESVRGNFVTSQTVMINSTIDGTMEYNSVTVDSSETSIAERDVLTKPMTTNVFSNNSVPITKVSTFNSDISEIASLDKSIFNDTRDKENRKGNNRGDNPVSTDSSNFIDSGENEIKFSQYSTVLGPPEPENLNDTGDSDIKDTTEEKYISTDKITRDGAAIATLNPQRNNGLRAFEKSPWNFPPSILSTNKIRKPPIYENTPMDNNFWKYLIISRKDTPATPIAKATITTTDEESRFNHGIRKAKKRGSLNTNVEKNFRWFYNYVHEDEKYPSKRLEDPGGIYIRCKKKERGEEQYF